MTFVDRNHYERFHGKVNGGKGGKKHKEDLEKFVDEERLKGVFMGESRSTGRDGGVVGWRFIGGV